MKTFLGLALLVILTVAASAVVVISTNPVHDYIQITNAVAQASSGDTILISTGVYAEVVRIGSKNLMLDGGYNHDGTAKVIGQQTVLDAGSFVSSGSVLDISNSVVNLATLDIRGGHGIIPTATYLGGGIKIRSSSVVTATSCRVYANEVHGKGGGIFVTNSSLYLLDTVVYSNEASRTSPTATPPDAFGWGGGICVESGRLILDGASVVSNNWAANEGGGIYSGESTTSIQHTDANVLANSASNGAGVAVNGGYFTIKSGADMANNIASGQGGGILLRNGATGLVSGSQTTIGLNSTVLGPNMATNGYGGGISVLSSLLVMSNTARVGHNRASQAGGGIYVSNGTCRIYNVYIGVSGGTNSAATGGGIAAQDSTVQVYGASQIIAGRALAGAGVAADRSQLYFEEGTIIGNDDTNLANLAWVGGGLYAGQSIIHLEGKVWNNMAGVLGGGGLALEDCYLVASNAQIIGNIAATTGGGVDWYGGSGTFQRVTMVSNSAQYGGGAYLSGPVRLECLPTNMIGYNAAAVHGGGLFCASTGLVTIMETNIRSNSAGRHGGGLGVVTGEVLIVDSQVSRNIAGGYGGGIYASNGVVTLFAATMNNFYNYNYASNGGCLAAERIGVFSLLGVSNLFITVNTASQDGGGAWMNNGILMGAGKVQVGANTAGDNGGGLYAENSGVVQLFPQAGNLPYIYNNWADRCGGGLCVTGAGSAVKLIGARVGLDFTDSPGGNTANGAGADDGGGGLSILAGTVCYLTNVWICNNWSGQYGGGINVDGARLIMGGNYGMLTPGDFRPPNNLLHNQATNASGGGLAVIRGTFQMRDVLIYSNTATRGGGLLLDGSSTGRVVNALIQCNSASVTGGAVHINPLSLGDFLHCTVVSNTRGGIVVSPTALFSLTNGIVGLNGSEQITAGQSVSYSDVAYGYAGAGNIMLDPFFIASTWYDCRLSYGSPCIDAGTAVPVTTDCIGEPRPYGASHDMGAYEYNRDTYDTDGDRMVDGWEADHSLDPLTADADVHSDSDPYVNGEEYIADTDPLDGDDYLRITSITNNPYRFVSFPSSTGRVYALRAVPFAADGVSWNTVGTNINVRGNGAIYTAADTNEPLGHAVYRVEVRLP